MSSTNISITVQSGTQPEPDGDYSVEIQIHGGMTLTYNMADGNDMLSYIAPSGTFKQECLRVHNDKLPHFFVDFRPDADSHRIEVVFWNGECMGDVPSNYHRDLGAYTAIICQGDAVLHTEEIPKHGWACRWRWCSEPRPVIRTADQVFAEGWLPHMSLHAARIEGYTGIIVPPVPPAVPPYTPFRGPDPGHTDYKCGIQLAVDGGGERAEIGLVTEWQADWLLRGTQSSFDAMMTQAEMMGSDWSVFVPDQMTGAAINYKEDDAHYNAYTYNSVYGPYYRISKGEERNGWDFHEAEAHIPLLAYLPYAVTDDPYHLETLQYILQWTLGWDIYNREVTYGMDSRIVASYGGEIRTYGWGIRNLAAAYKASPEVPPLWLQPKSYFADVSHDMSMVSHDKWMTSNKPLHKVFRQISYDAYWQAFMQAYAIMGMSLADLVAMPTGDAPSWHDQLEFYFGWFDAMCSPDSGWDRQAPQPHDILAADMDATDSWGAAWDMVKVKYPSFNAYPDVPEPGNHQAGSMGNCSQITAACACAVSRKIPAAPAAKAWMDEFVDFNYPSGTNEFGIAFYAKCGFDGT